MKRILTGIFFLAILTGIVGSAYFVYNKQVLKQSITKNQGDYVVLLHGLGRSSFSMQKLGKNLAKKGYRVINIAYPTRSDTIENLVEKNLKVELDKTYTDREKKINFVTHSMGGIMVRHFLANTELKNVNRVVMLAPPNQGSEAADEWSKSKFMRSLLGPALLEMTTTPKNLVHMLPLPFYEVGIIAGESDEKVSVENTKLKNMKDFLVVQREHTFIMNADEVSQAVVNFLDTGKF